MSSCPSDGAAIEPRSRYGTPDRTCLPRRCPTGRLAIRKPAVTKLRNRPAKLRLKSAAQGDTVRDPLTYGVAQRMVLLMARVAIYARVSGNGNRQDTDNQL